MAKRRHRKKSRKNPSRRRRHHARRRHTNPRRHFRRVHHRRRRNPEGGRLSFGKGLVYLGIGTVSALAAYGLPALLKLSGPLVYAPAGALTAGGLVLMKKRPFLGLALAGGAVAGAGTPVLFAKLAPSQMLSAKPTATKQLTGKKPIGDLADDIIAEFEAEMSAVHIEEALGGRSYQGGRADDMGAVHVNGLYPEPDPNYS